MHVRSNERNRNLPLDGRQVRSNEIRQLLKVGHVDVVPPAHLVGLVTLNGLFTASCPHDLRHGSDALRGMLETPVSATPAVFRLGSHLGEVHQCGLGELVERLFHRILDLCKPVFQRAPSFQVGS